MTQRVYLRVANGDHALQIKYVGRVDDPSLVFQAGHDLLPVFESEAKSLKVQALAFTAVQESRRFGWLHEAKTYTAVFLLEASGEWTPVAPKSSA